MSARDNVISLLQGHPPPRPPRFSGLVHVTEAGLETLGYRFSEIHTDAHKLAAAAATSYRLYGWESAVVPADLCVEAAALGATVDYHSDIDVPIWPVVAQSLAEGAASLRLSLPQDVASEPRIETVVEALRLLKADVGSEVAVGAWVPGPLTLAMQLVPIEALYSDIRSLPTEVGRVLDTLVVLLQQVGSIYRGAGADFLTVHEMGGSPAVIGPAAFAELVLPRVERLLAALPGPRVLSICGRLNRSLPLLAGIDVEAISIDETTDMRLAHEVLGPRQLVFGNIAPVKVLSEGSSEEVRAAVRRAIAEGADTVWPGCDLPPSVPPENMRAFAGEI